MTNDDVTMRVTMRVTKRVTKHVTKRKTQNNQSPFVSVPTKGILQPNFSPQRAYLNALTKASNWVLIDLSWGMMAGTARSTLSSW